MVIITRVEVNVIYYNVQLSTFESVCSNMCGQNLMKGLTVLLIPL